MRRIAGLALALAIAGAGWAQADVWDTEDDTPANTRNEMINGGEQVHDGAGTHSALGATGDEDWYIVQADARSSYEFRIDGFNRDTTHFMGIYRYASNGTSTLALSICDTGASGTYAFSRCWENSTGTAAQEFINVTTYDSAGDSDDNYTARFYETSVAVPRYNNSSGQVTVLLIQNPTAYSISGNAYLWNVAGTLVTTVPFTVTAKQLSSNNLASVNAGIANNTNGSVTISHTGRYGDLAVKSVALEPATGFSFDSPGLFRQH